MQIKNLFARGGREDGSQELVIQVPDGGGHGQPVQEAGVVVKTTVSDSDIPEVPSGDEDTLEEYLKAPVEDPSRPENV